VYPVRGVALSVRSGETVGLVGESGCGKTMTAVSIMRLLPPGGEIVSGSVRLAGQELTTLSEPEMRKLRGSEMAMVFQDPVTSLNPTMTIGDQITGPLRSHLGASKKQARDRAEEVLALVGIPKPAERLADYPHQLSGGQCQRVMIAMAIACEPKLLIADEPTTALDVTIQAQILGLLDDLKARLGMGMLLITHDLGVIAGMADRVMVMYAGAIVESAQTPELFRQMRHPYTEALLESIPLPDTDRSKTFYSIPGLPPDLTRTEDGCRFAPRCRYATERCRKENPPLMGDEPSHPYACFHPIPVYPLADRPFSSLSGDHSGDGIEQAVAEPFLTVEHLVKTFAVGGGVPHSKGDSVKAVSDVSFSVARGETFGLVGESGCGKTTIARLLVALDQPESGSIQFDGLALNALADTALRQRRRDFQLIFQDPTASLDPRIRVGPALREAMIIHRVGTPPERDARVAELLREVGLDGRAPGR